MSKTISHLFRLSFDLNITIECVEPGSREGCVPVPTGCIGTLPDKDGQKGNASNNVITKLPLEDALLYRRPQHPKPCACPTLPAAPRKRIVSHNSPTSTASALLMLSTSGPSVWRTLVSVVAACSVLTQARKRVCSMHSLAA